MMKKPIKKELNIPILRTDNWGDEAYNNLKIWDEGYNEACDDWEKWLVEQKLEPTVEYKALWSILEEIDKGFGHTNADRTGILKKRQDEWLFNTQGLIPLNEERLKSWMKDNMSFMNVRGLVDRYAKAICSKFGTQRKDK